MSQEMTITQWHVPVDDENCYWYAIFTSYTTPVDKKKMREQRLELYELPDYKSRKNRSNDYGFDPHEQATETYTGMGLSSADPEAYELPRNVGIKLNDKDVSRAKELLGYTWFQKKDWQTEIKRMSSVLSERGPDELPVSRTR